LLRPLSRSGLRVKGLTEEAPDVSATEGGKIRSVVGDSTTFPGRMRTGNVGGGKERESRRVIKKFCIFSGDYKLPLKGEK